MSTGMGAFVAPRSSASAVAERQRDLNARTIPPMLPAIQKISDETTVYVFNVGPWQHTRPMGEMGNKVIPACPEGKRYSEPLKVAGIVTSYYPDTEKTMKVAAQEEGWDVAQSILAVGPGFVPAFSLVRAGVWACRQWPPTEEEIATAWNNLVEGELSSLISNANEAAANGPRALEQTLTKRHYQAARLLKKTVADCPWMERAQATTERVECKFCGEPMKQGIPRCPNCKEIVDQELFDQLKGKKKN